MRSEFKYYLVLTSCWLCGLGGAIAQESVEDRLFIDYLEQAIQFNPSIKEKKKQFDLSVEQVGLTRSFRKPTVDLTADYSRVDLNNNLIDDRFSAYSTQLRLTQMLYDGAQTRNQIDSFKQQQLLKYFELLEEIDTVILETAIAYIDTKQYQELVILAEENLRTHIDVFKQVEKGVSAGVSRRVDLEQVSGRLALSESNLLTEQSNLHDVTTRFLRLTGTFPDENLPKPNYTPVQLGNDLKSIIENAYQYNPRFNEALYNISAKEFSLKQTKGENRPKVTFSASYGLDSQDALGNDNQIREARVGLSISYRFYDGGARSARKQIAITQLEQAKDLRDLQCLNLRQSVQIAYNDIILLEQKLPSLQSHKGSSNRVKSAYMDQFTINERTLVDVLDSESEYYESARAYIEAVNEYDKAKLVLLFNVGKLAETFPLKAIELPTIAELTDNIISFEPSSICPAVSVSERINNIMLKDSDDDGIVDLWDECKDTPSGESVDFFGCTQN